MTRVLGFHRDTFVVLYDFLKPTSGSEPFEITVAALSVVELAFIVGAVMLIPNGLELLGTNYRLLLTLITLGFAAVNFIFWYPRRDEIQGYERPSKRRHTAISILLASPTAMIFLALIIKGVNQ